MATATFKQALTLSHRANLGEEPEQIEFQTGEKVTVLKEWADRYLCKNEGGQLFNVPKEYLQAD